MPACSSQSADTIAVNATEQDDTFPQYPIAGTRRGGIGEVFRSLFDDELPISFRCYDGSVAGSLDPFATVGVRSPHAIGHLLRAPGQLGLARAYVTGAIEVRGDLHAVCPACAAHPSLSAYRPLRGPVDATASRHGPTHRASSARTGGRGTGSVAPRAAPAHPAARTVAIAHHYDVSNRFYELLLGSSMAYSCAVFMTADTTLDAAQAEKFDLICRKLELRPGQRLLDVGAGWGGLVRHAADITE